MTPQKNHNNFPVTINKTMEICEIHNKEFKIAILKKLIQLQKTTERKFKEIQEAIQKQNQKFNRDYRNYKKEPNRYYGAEECNE